MLTDITREIGILVMGLTGAGKSAFISQLTQQDVEIGHSLESCTTDAMGYFFHRKNGQKVYLIDTPGFDDTHEDNAKVFREIATLICTVCDGHRLFIGGMIYVQRITDMRMSGSSLNSLRIFEKICGEHCFEDVTIVTTMWGLLKTEEARDAAIAREEMLRSRPEYFGNLVNANARMERHNDNHDSALHIIETLADRRRKVHLQLQREMKRSETMTLGETTVGRYLEGELKNVRKKYETERRELQDFQSEVLGDDDLKSTIGEQITEYSELVNKTEMDQRSLSITCDDMRCEQREWCIKRRYEELEETVANIKSARVLELEEQLQRSAEDIGKLQRENQAQRWENRVQSVELQDQDKKFEADKKELEDQIKRDKAAREKARLKRLFYFHFLWFARDVLPKDGKEPGNSPRRADSLPVEAKLSLRHGSKHAKKGALLKSRHNGKLRVKFTPSSDDRIEQQNAAHQYSEEQYSLSHDQSYKVESEDELEDEDPQFSIYGQSFTVSQAQSPTMKFPNNGNICIPPATFMGPNGLVRNPPMAVNNPHRRYPSPEKSPKQPKLTGEKSPEDIIIAVMGITGCGKTTFVNFFSEQPLPVGHGLDSCTESVQVVPCTLEDGVKIYLVDTPGFDDSYRSDSEILREVALWLNKAHASDLKLSGIILLQRISDVRVGGSGIKNIKMFQKLCGDDTLASVVLATTMWDMALEKAAIDREKELKQQPQLWKRMIDYGSQVFRHDQEKTSALKIIKYLVARKRPVTLDIQREMVDQKLELLQTGAGGELASAVEKLIQHYEKKLKELESDLKEAWEKRDQERRDILKAAKKEHQENLTKNKEELLKLRISAEQLVEEAKKLYEKTAKETMKQSEEKHAKDLDKQRIFLQKQFKENYFRMMSERACAVM
ncbi:hypothetical protein EJ02DRAFT_406290 [Clathrospora elynae]|uniref:G domain-containing protein n=1 Tax=Clathrospora elynae TaxID=706981 RepID=A0A6A5SLW1_9PLEO|nr:hypothetical protein EJ02DRAFT_406290 [Clathrospora elynae]